MKQFEIHPRLNADCHRLGRFGLSHLLLHQSCLLFGLDKCSLKVSLSCPFLLHCCPMHCLKFGTAGSLGRLGPIGHFYA